MTSGPTHIDGNQISTIKTALLILNRVARHPERLLRHVVDLASIYGFDLTVISSIEPDLDHLRRASRRTTSSDTILRDLHDLGVEARRDEIKELLDKCSMPPGQTITIKAVVGPVSSVVAAAASEGTFDIVLVPPQTRRPLVSKWLLGSEELRILRVTRCPVAVLRSPFRAHKVLIALDYPGDSVSGEALNQRLLDYGLIACRGRKAELHLAHVWTDTGEDGPAREKWLADLAEQMSSAQPEGSQVVIKPHFLTGSPGGLLPELIEDLSVATLVIGAYTKDTVWPFYLGHTAEGILHQVDCSVLVIPPAHDGSTQPR